MKSLDALNASIIDRCFLSPRIRDRLKGITIEPEVLSALILTSPLSLDEKHSFFLELAEGYGSHRASIFSMCARKIGDVLLETVSPTNNDPEPNSVRLMSAEHLLSLIDDALECAKGEEGDEKEGDEDEPEDEPEDEQWITFTSVDGEIKVAEDDQEAFEAFRNVLDDALAAVEVSEDGESPIVVSVDGRPVYALSKRLSALAFGDNDEILFKLQSLFVGLLQPGAILELDFRPFYERRYGIVLEASRVMKDSMSGEDYVQSERVLVNTPDGWECGELAWRDDLLKCLDPIGPFLNSYSQVRELNAEEVMSLCAKQVTKDLNLLWEIRDYIGQEPKLAVAITELMKSRDHDGLEGMSDDELLKVCKSTFESLYRD
ncbi:hypothetical protein [Anaerotardibacter muris]|uniref:hypothetical protein n=1 Tax=Anaerotardibacter muris TaxID=2941505 RepID=UPI00203A76B5|nr:hypothetical protein [Anaerotardibacter muris]